MRANGLTLSPCPLRQWRIVRKTTTEAARHERKRNERKREKRKRERRQVEANLNQLTFKGHLSAPLYLLPWFLFSSHRTGTRHIARYPGHWRAREREKNNIKVSSLATAVSGMSELIINMNYCIKCQYWLRVSLLTVIVSSIFTEAAAYLEGKSHYQVKYLSEICAGSVSNTYLFLIYFSLSPGSIVKCYNEGQEVAIPFMRDDPCYRCKCLSTEIVCVDTCSHKKCHFNGKMYKVSQCSQ